MDDARGTGAKGNHGISPRWRTKTKRRQLNISREPRTGWRTVGKAGSGGDKGGPSGNLRGIEDLVHSPTRQRAGLAPRNPVLALTHRYLSHDHFRCLSVHCTYIYVRTSTNHLYYSYTHIRISLYHLQCPLCRQRSRVPCLI